MAKQTTHHVKLTTDESDLEPIEPGTFAEHDASDRAPAAPPAGLPEPVARVATGLAPTIEQWAQLIDALKTNKVSDVKMAAELHALAMKKALRPEEESPLISIYNPKGEREYPRPKPACAFFLRTFPICDPGDYATVTGTEIELLNQLKPGAYTVTKADGLEVKLKVQPEYDSTGKTLTRLTLDLPIGDDEQKQNWPPLMQLLTEAITGESPAHSFERMRRRIADLEAQLAASTAA